MSWLPDEFDIQDYISSCLSLLKSWSWLFQEKTTDILKAGLLDKPPASEILSYLSQLTTEELKNIPKGSFKEEWPSDLKDFIRKCHTLKVKIRREEFPITQIDSKYFLRMKFKKQEEVAQLSSMVMRECSKHSIRHIIDIGSGLGYVDRVLNQVYGFEVLGFEKDLNKVNKAFEMGGSIQYREAYLSEDSLQSFIDQIKDWLKGSSACFIALHGCGDLSPLVAKLFSGIEEGKCLILIPCCYHLSKSRPLSGIVKDSEVVNTNLLRIACESTSERWLNSTEEQHTSHAVSVLARALVEVFPSQDCVNVKKKFRHSLRYDARNDWDKCLNICLERFTGIDKEKLTLAWKGNHWRIDQIKAYSCLQVCLQGVAEGLVLADTFLFLKSILHSNVHIKVLRIFDVIKSPRSLAFVVNR